MTLHQAALNVAAQQLDLLTSLPTEELETAELLKLFKIVKKNIKRNKSKPEFEPINGQLYNLLASTYTEINNRILTGDADATEVLSFGDLLGDVSRDLLERYSEELQLEPAEDVQLIYDIDDELNQYL